MFDNSQGKSEQFLSKALEHLSSNRGVQSLLPGVLLVVYARWAPGTLQFAMYAIGTLLSVAGWAILMFDWLSLRWSSRRQSVDGLQFGRLEDGVFDEFWRRAFGELDPQVSHDGPYELRIMAHSSWGTFCPQKFNEIPDRQANARAINYIGEKLETHLEGDGESDVIKQCSLKGKLWSHLMKFIRDAAPGVELHIEVLLLSPQTPRAKSVQKKQASESSHGKHKKEELRDAVIDPYLSLYILRRLHNYHANQDNYKINFQVRLLTAGDMPHSVYRIEKRALVAFHDPRGFARDSRCIWQVPNDKREKTHEFIWTFAETEFKALYNSPKDGSPHAGISINFPPQKNEPNLDRFDEFLKFIWDQMGVEDPENEETNDRE